MWRIPLIGDVVVMLVVHIVAHLLAIADYSLGTEPDPKSILFLGTDAVPGACELSDQS